MSLQLHTAVFRSSLLTLTCLANLHSFSVLAKNLKVWKKPMYILSVAASVCCLASNILSYLQLQNAILPDPSLDTRTMVVAFYFFNCFQVIFTTIITCVRALAFIERSVLKTVIIIVTVILDCLYLTIPILIALYFPGNTSAIPIVNAITAVSLFLCAAHEMFCLFLLLKQLSFGLGMKTFEWFMERDIQRVIFNMILTVLYVILNLIYNSRPSTMPAITAYWIYSVLNYLGIFYQALQLDIFICFSFESIKKVVQKHSIAIKASNGTSTNFRQKSEQPTL